MVQLRQTGLGVACQLASPKRRSVQGNVAAAAGTPRSPVLPGHHLLHRPGGMHLAGAVNVGCASWADVAHYGLDVDGLALRATYGRRG